YLPAVGVGEHPEPVAEVPDARQEEDDPPPSAHDDLRSARAWGRRTRPPRIAMPSAMAAGVRLANDSETCCRPRPSMWKSSPGAYATPARSASLNTRSSSVPRGSI